LAKEVAMDVGKWFLDGVVSVFYITLVLAATVVPCYLIIRAELRKLRDPAYLRAAGVLIRTLKALDAVAEVIGRYNGTDIYRYVIFKGMRYEFDHIIPLGLPRQVGENELLIEPGVVYVTA
jgi:hypothetical protein